MTLNKYLVAMLQVAMLFLAAFQAALTDGVTPTEAWQLAGLFVGAVVTYYSPVLAGAWAAGLKVGGAVLGAAIAAIVPFVTEGWNAMAVTIVVIAVVNALATQFGVDARVDSAKVAILDPATRNVAVEIVDPKGLVAAQRSLGTSRG